MLSGMKWRTGLPLALLLFAFMMTAHAQSPGQRGRTQKKLTITVAETAVRKFPSEWYAELGRATKGDTFVYYGITQSGWYQIQYGNQIGYVKADHAAPVPSQRTGQAAVRKVKPGPAREARSLSTPETETAVEELPAPQFPEKRRFPWVWIVIGAVAVALYVLYFIHNIREQKRFEEYLRHKTS